MPRIFMGPHCKKKTKIQVLYRAEDDIEENQSERTVLTEQMESESSSRGTPSPVTDGRGSERPVSPGSPVEGEVTSTTTCGTSPVRAVTPERLSSRGRPRKLGGTERSAFRRLNLSPPSEHPRSLHPSTSIGFPATPGFIPSPYLTKPASQQTYQDHMHLINYPLLAPAGTSIDHPTSALSRAPLLHSTTTVSPTEYNPVAMTRYYDIPYHHVAPVSHPTARLDLLGYTDPRMPITNYYLTAARMKYEQLHQHHMMMAALTRGSFSHGHKHRHSHSAFSPTMSPRKSEIDMIKTPLNEKHSHKKFPSQSETVSSPESVALDGNKNPESESPSPRDKRIKLELETPAETITSTSRPSKALDHSPEGLSTSSPSNSTTTPPTHREHALSAHAHPVLSVTPPTLPGYPSPLEARYHSTISPPSFSVFSGSSGVLPTSTGIYYSGLNPGRQRDPNKPAVLKKYKCDICGKAFSRSNTLVTHKRIHTGEKPFKCDLCGRAFRQPGNLTRHKLTHTTVKPYVCPVCKKAFNRASNLNTHMRTHTNYRPYICGRCGKGFHQKIDLKIHSYTHTG